MKPIALALVALLSSPGLAAADGETSPLLGVTLVGSEAASAPNQLRDLAGAGVDLAWWHGRFGLAAEGSARWSIDPADNGARAFVLGGSARFRLLDRMLPSLMEPRDVELGLELQAIVERAWWSDRMSIADPTAYGFGVALRLRGGGDAPGSLMLAESRFFLRVTSAAWAPLDGVARTTPMPTSTTDRAFTVLLGIGASWGSGAPGYVARFRPRPFGSGLLL